MAERDAFGNEIIRAEPASAPAPAPEPAPGFGDPAPGFGDPGERPRPAERVARVGGRAVRAIVGGWVALAVVAAGIGLVVLSDVREVSDGGEALQRSVSSAVHRLTVPEAPLAPATPSAKPTGLGPRSLLLRANFTAALATLRSEGSRLRTLRVAPDRLDASIVTADGYMKQVQVTSDGRLQRFGRTGPGFPLTGTFTIDGLVRSAPFRLALSAAERSGRTPAAVDYLVAISLGSGQGWTVILKGGGGQYLADHAGRIQRRIS